MNLANHFLISMPHLQDDIFTKSVVFICEHNQNSGALGFIINKTTGLTIDTIFNKFKLPLKRQDLRNQLVYMGGPVQFERGFILHEKIVPQADSEQDQIKTNSVYLASLPVGSDLELTTSFDILESVAMNAGPKKVFFALGCSSWAAKQLEDEIVRNSWLVAPAKDELIFDVPIEQRYEQALALLGINAENLSSFAGTA